MKFAGREELSRREYWSQLAKLYRETETVEVLPAIFGMMKKIDELYGDKLDVDE